MKDTEQRHEQAPSSAAAQRESRENGGQLSTQLAGSPRQLAQRRAIKQALGGAVQRVEGALDEEDDSTAQLRAEPAQRQENRTGMPDDLKAGIESLSGMDMSDVRVHPNSSQPAQLNALAYAQGNDIHLGPGQEQHLPHEAWHVVQQRQGRVKPTMQLAGVGVNDDEGLESEADVMGGRAVQLRGVGGKTLKPPSNLMQEMVVEAGPTIAPQSPRHGGAVQLYNGTRGQVFQQWSFRSAGFIDGVITAARANVDLYFAEGVDTDAVTQQFVDQCVAGLLMFVNHSLSTELEQEQVVGTITMEMRSIADGWFLKKPQVLRQQATAALSTIRNAVAAALDSTDAPTRNQML